MGNKEGEVNKVSRDRAHLHPVDLFTMDPDALAGLSPGSLFRLLQELHAETEHRKTGESLATEIQERYARAIAESPFPIMIHAEDGEVIEINKVWTELTGFTHAEIPTIADWTEKAYGERQESVKARIDHLYEQDGRVDEGEYFINSKDGVPLVWAFSSAPLGNLPDGRRLVVSIANDVTARKAAEEEVHRLNAVLEERVAERTRELAESEARLRLMAENVQDVIWTMDLNFNYTYFSPSVAAMRGISVEDAVSQSMEDAMPRKSLAIAKQIFEEELAKEKKGTADPNRSRTMIVDLKRGDGSTVPVEIIVSFIRDEDGKAVQIMGVTRDISERLKAERERKELEAQVQHAQKLESLGLMAGGVAHDFNNLLLGILGNADLLAQDLSPAAPGRGPLEDIIECAQRAAELCKQLLAYSGKGKFTVQPADLSVIMRDMAHLLEVSISKKAEIVFDFEDDLPAVEADVAQMQQIIMNLITNASDALEERSGVITIRTGARDCDEAYLSGTYLDNDLDPGRYVYIEVSDTGCGIEKEALRKIFEPFFTSKFTGRGLGLAAVLGIIRGHKGAIEVKSSPGKGTTFRVLFPASDKPALSIHSADVGLVDWKGSGTILVVDDEESIRDLARRILTRAGFDVLLAVDGMDGVKVFTEHLDEIKAVLLDVTMPRLDGDEAFEEMHRICDTVPVVLTSGYDAEEASARFTGLGLAAFIQKPYLSNELVNIMREVLSSV